MNYQQLLQSMTPDTYQRIKRALELGKWPDGQRLTPEQREVSAAITAGPRGEVRGPFIPLLYNAPAANAVQQMGAFLRFEGTLPGDLREMVILVVARHWTVPVNFVRSLWRRVVRR